MYHQGVILLIVTATGISYTPSHQNKSRVGSIFRGGGIGNSRITWNTMGSGSNPHGMSRANPLLWVLEGETQEKAKPGRPQTATAFHKEENSLPQSEPGTEEKGEKDTRVHLG